MAIFHRSAGMDASNLKRERLSAQWLLNRRYGFTDANSASVRLLAPMRKVAGCR